jgi:Zn-dependent protease/predicted transcriptional regulator
MTAQKAAPPASGLAVGRIAGIEIRVDPSWIIIAALITFSLAGYYRATLPSIPEGSVWIAALASSLLFFASVLLHELSHSLVARAKGMHVMGITLFIFGGVSRLRGEPAGPKEELQIAIVGPLASFALAALFYGASAVLPAGTLFYEIAAWLSLVNLTLAVFNLVPGFPLDGGRIFRAAVWAATRDHLKATRLATFAGSVVAYCLIALGALYALGLGQIVAGLWIAFIGWFLLSAARSTLAQTQLKEFLSKLTVSQAMKKGCDPVRPAESVRDLVEGRVLLRGERCFMVSDNGALSGIVTLQEIKGLPKDRWEATPVSEIMVPISELVTARPDAPLVDAVQSMEESGVAQIPVVDEDHLVGVLTREDILRLVAAHLELAGPH